MMPHIPIAVCVPCGSEYKILKNGFEVRMFAGGKAYYQVSGDCWECPKCHHRIVVGFGMAPLWQNFHKEGPPACDLEADLLN